MLQRTLPAAMPSTLELSESLQAILRFGTMLLRSGTTTFRIRELMGILARRMGVSSLDVHVTLNGIVATASSGDQVVTRVSENVTIGVNANCLSAFHRLSNTLPVNVSPEQVHAMLDRIEKLPRLYSLPTTSIAVGLACGAFGYFNGAGPVAVVGATISAAIAQLARSLLLGKRVNQFAVTALCSFLAPAVYWLFLCLAAAGGHPIAAYQAGFISSVLLLVPGFPLLTSLLDMVKFDFVAGLTRFAYSVTLLISGGIGLCVVSALAGLTTVGQPTPRVPGFETFCLRAVASFIGGAGFAVLYNSPRRATLVVGLLAIVGNELRLGLHDVGMAMAPATFFGALAVGLLATPAVAWAEEPRIALTVPGIIVMIPGAFAYNAIVFFNQGTVSPAVHNAIVTVLIVGAMASGLAVARMISDREWAFET